MKISVAVWIMVIKGVAHRLLTAGLLRRIAEHQNEPQHGEHRDGLLTSWNSFAECPKKPVHARAPFEL